MYDKTCCSADCPKTADRLIRGLCELWYPYGGKQRCQKTLDNWIKQDEKIAKIHQEYLKRGREIMYLEKNENKKPKPFTYDMTFCVSKCKNKCERHYSKYSFDTGRLYSMAEFNCRKEVENGNNK